MNETYFEYAKETYDLNAGKKVVTDEYEGFVSGYHYQVDGNDSCSLIVTITKNKTNTTVGVKYMIRGDVFVVNPGEKRYELIRDWDLPKYGLEKLTARNQG